MLYREENKRSGGETITKLSIVQLNFVSTSKYIEQIVTTTIPCLSNRNFAETCPENKLFNSNRLST